MIPFIKPILPSAERYQQHIYDMHENEWFSNNGPLVQQFEKALQKYLKTQREIVVVSNATIGLILALKGLQEIQDLKQVIVPSFTFAATIAAIEWCKMDYKYVDIDSTWSASVEDVERLLREGEFEALMPVHTFGGPCRIEELESIAKKNNIKLIFDAAPAMGSLYRNQPIGNFGDIEVFSLHATKVLPVGEGGFLSIKDKEVADHVRQLKNFGFDSNKIVASNGLNGKMPEMMAAIGIEALKDVDQHLRNRKMYIEKYKEILGDMVQYQEVIPDSSHSFQSLGVLVENAEQVVFEMEKRDIQVRRYFSDPMHTHLAYRQCGTDLSMTNRVAKEIINLPLYSIMDEHTIECVCSNLKDIINGS